MAYTRQYTDRVNWQNSPSLATPLNATNLNKMDAGLSNVDSAVASEFESVEQDISDLQSAVGGAVTDVTVDGTSVVTQGVAAIPAIPSVPVQDVQVDDVSIVDANGIAKLDSSDFGTTVVANPSGTPSANLQKLQVGNGIYGIEQVSANVAVSTLAAPLTTLKIGDDEYTVPSGGGTNVVANPSGTATDDLEKIQIGNTIYDIPGSGSGGQQYTCDLLFENDPLPSPTSGTSGVTRTYTLNHSIDDYDAVYVASVLSYSQGYEQQDGVLIFKRDYYFTATYSGEEKYSFCINNLSVPAAVRRLFGRFTDDITLQTYTADKESSAEPMLYKVYGLKFAATTINNPVYLSDYYSTEERVVGRSLNGKPVYQKTINVASLSNGQNTIAHNISNYEDLYGIAGQCKYNNLSETLSLPYVSLNSGYDIGISNVDATNIKVFVGDNFASVTDCRITLQYTKTTDAAGTGPTAGNIIYLPALYSEEEREVGVWTDGKPLYQKSFYFANMTKKTYYNGVSGVDKAFCVAVSFGAEQISPAYVSTAAVSGSTSIDCEVNSNVMQFWASSENDLTDVYITMQYTKVADTPGSGTWTPEGQIAHHYLTSEHIVGTDEDGNTVYEITAKNISISSLNTWIDTGITFVGDVISVEGVMIRDNVPVILGAFGDGSIISSWRYQDNKIKIQQKGFSGESYSCKRITVRYTKTS